MTVLCFGAMREYLEDGPSGRARIELATGGTVRGVIDALGAPERLVHSVLVDGARVEFDEVLHDGAEVTLMPPFAGGSS